MSEHSSDVADESAHIPCHFLAYRMVPSDSQWIEEDGTLDPAIFYRRAIDKDGVSLTTTIQAGLRLMKKVRRPVEGALSLHVGWVRNIDKLDVVRRRAADTHAVITGLPYSNANPKEAEQLANKLLEIARAERLPAS